MSRVTRSGSRSHKIRFRTAPLQPPSEQWFELDNRLPADDPARVIFAGLARLDLTVLWNAYGGTGSVAYPPHLLLAAAIYEIRQGHRSPALWCRHAKQSDGVRWLLHGFTPSRSCWYNFRDRLGPVLDDLNQRLLHDGVAERLTSAERGALDGTLIAANASRHRLVNQETLNRRLTQLAAVVASDQPKAPQEARQQPQPATQQPSQTPVASESQRPSANTTAPTAAKQTPEPAKTALPGWLAKTTTGRQKQLQAYQRAGKRMEQIQAQNRARPKSKRRKAEKLVVSLSASEAALGLDKEKVFRPLYNVQLLNDVDSPFILAYRTLAQVHDAGQVGPMLHRQKQMTGRQVKVLLTDAGYTGGPDLAEAKKAEVTIYGPWQSNDYSAAKKKEGKQIAKSEFTWQAEQKVYVCPQGKRLEYVGTQKQPRATSGKVSLEMYQAKAEDCRQCAMRPKCTAKAEGGRTVSRSEHEELIEALRQRMATEQGKQLYRLRRIAGERLNADFKQHRQFRKFSGRGLCRASTETALMVLGHNLITAHFERANALTRSSNSPRPLPITPFIPSG